MRTVVKADGLRVHLCPKVATASLSAALSARKWPRVKPEESGDELRIIPVRHPFDRMVSAWAFFCNPAFGQVNQQGRMSSVGYRMGMTFEAFVAKTLDHYRINRHLRPQADFAGPHWRDARLVPLHRLTEEWERIMGQFPYLKPIQTHHRTSHEPWEAIFPDHLRERAELIFARDIEIWTAAVGEVSLAEKYEAAFGKPPHHRMKDETIRRKLDEAAQSCAGDAGSEASHDPEGGILDAGQDMPEGAPAGEDAGADQPTEDNNA